MGHVVVYGVVGKERGGWTGTHFRLGLGPQHACVLGPCMSCALPWLTAASALTHLPPAWHKGARLADRMLSIVAATCVHPTFNTLCPPSSTSPVCRPAVLLPVLPPWQVLVYGEKLDLGPFMAAGAMDDGPATYTLTGVVVHLDQVRRGGLC